MIRVRVLGDKGDRRLRTVKGRPEKNISGYEKKKNSARPKNPEQRPRTQRNTSVKYGKLAASTTRTQLPKTKRGTVKH